MSVFVVRTNEVARTVEFFEKLGLSFVREQHGNGPIHFACERNGIVFEIYPTEKKNTCKFIETEA
jgi:lactoylglutathione lyase